MRPSEERKEDESLRERGIEEEVEEEVEEKKKKKRRGERLERVIYRHHF